jgi:hypothetical protein
MLDRVAWRPGGMSMAVGLYMSLAKLTYEDRQSWTFPLDATLHDPAFICYANC